MEQAEDQLLEELGERTHKAAVELEHSELCAGMTGEQVRLLQRYVTTAQLKGGTRIYANGEPGGTLYVIRRGNVDVRLTTSRKHYSRLARLGPGMLFGEASFHVGGAHTATAVATDECNLWVLEREAFDRISAEHPSLAVCILKVTGAWQTLS